MKISLNKGHVLLSVSVVLMFKVEWGGVGSIPLESLVEFLFLFLSQDPSIQVSGKRLGNQYNLSLGAWSSTQAIFS